MTNCNANDPAIHDWRGTIYLQAINEVLGCKTVEKLLRQAEMPPTTSLDAEALNCIHARLEETYGRRSGHGLELRSGQALFKYGLRAFGARLGFTELYFRMLPPRARLKEGLHRLAAGFDCFGGQPAQLTEEPGRFLFQVQRCPGCHLVMGILKEAASWLGGGKTYFVREIACQSQGSPACTFEILKKPLE